MTKEFKAMLRVCEALQDKLPHVHVNYSMLWNIASSHMFTIQLSTIAYSVLWNTVSSHMFTIQQPKPNQIHVERQQISVKKNRESIC